MQSDLMELGATLGCPVASGIAFKLTPEGRIPLAHKSARMSATIVKAFAALRPTPEVASQVASVPYDVVDRDEAAALVEGKPLSFLRIGRAEVTLPEEVDPYDPQVYERARENMQALIDAGHLVTEEAPSLYLYRLTWRGRSQFGVVGAYSVQAYRDSRIKRHEFTRKAKEDDRTNHILTTRAQTGPVFLVHRPSDAVTQLRAALLGSSQAPLFDFDAGDGVTHTVWRIADPAPWEAALEAAGDFYIADGHHRAASAERTATRLNAGEEDAASRFLAVAFPTDEVAILPYHRILLETNGHSLEKILEEAQARFGASEIACAEGGYPEVPELGTVGMYLGGRWYGLKMPAQDPAKGPAYALDSAVLQREFLEPVFGIADVRSDARIDFVGGIRGVGELKERVDSGRAKVAFALGATRLDDLLEVSDADEIMPPKSTWFEPKLRDGLLIHRI
jgi:uncharacterized protein (DUF1015 family)